jgi:hypothetical protein
MSKGAAMVGRILCAIVLLAIVPLARAEDKPHVDVVFCIDCSGSMGGVIETAKMKVWDIVNQISKAKPSPILRIGLIGYGNADRSHRMFELSDDLDAVYKNLLTFKDEGWGDEYVGLAVHKATTEMKWSEGKQVMKIIYVVGNETAEQGPLSYKTSAPAAIGKGIMVNAIYCGNTDYQTAPPTWKEMAKLADGQYMEIAGDGGAITIATPFDARLNELNGSINKTYIGYGVAAPAAAQAQQANDTASNSFGLASGAARAVAKSSAQYRNSTWDLVDASREKDFDLSKIKTEELPQEMQKMSMDERKAYIETKAAERAKVQEEIKELAAKRDAFIRDEISKKGLKTDSALDESVKKSLKDAGQKSGFQFN